MLTPLWPDVGATDRSAEDNGVVLEYCVWARVSESRVTFRRIGSAMAARERARVAAEVHIEPRGWAG